MFYYKKRGGKNDSRQIAFFVGGERDTMRGRWWYSVRGDGNRKVSLPLQPHFEDEFLREWENGRKAFLFIEEQSVLLSACQTLVRPPRPPPIRTIPWKLFCLSCGKFVQIKAFKADVCYRYNRQTGFSLLLVGYWLFFFSSVFLMVE